MLAWVFALMLPSCATRMLWEDSEPTSRTVLAGESAQESRGHLSFRGDQVVWRGDDGTVCLADATGPHADRLRALLCHPGYFDVREVRVDLANASLDGRLLGSNSEVFVRFGALDDGLLEVVPEQELAPAAVARLSQGVLGDPRIPTVHRELVDAVALADVGAALDRPGAYEVRSQAFLAPDGAPAFQAAAPATAAETPASVGDRLDRLRGVVLLLRLEGPDGTVYAKAAPDRVWLATQLGTLGPGEVELVVPIDMSASEPATEQSPRRFGLPAVMLRREVRYARDTQSHGSMSVWAKLALTPFAIALDVAGGALFAWLLDDDEEEEDDEHGRTRRVQDNGNLDNGLLRARPRRNGESEAEWRARENGR